MKPTPAMVVAGRTLAEPRLSPDATCVVVHVRDAGGSRLVRIDLGPDQLSRPGPELTLTCDPPIVGVHPSGGGSWCWMPDGQSLLYVAKDGLYCVPRSGGPGSLVLGNLEGRWFSSPSISPDGSAVVLISEDDESQWVVVAKTDGSMETEVLGFASSEFAMDPTFGADGRVAWHMWSAPNMPWDSSTICVHTSGSVPTVFRTDAVSVSQPRFSPDGATLGYVADHRGWMNVCVDDEPVVGESLEHATPSWGAGQRSWCWSPDGTSVAFVRNESGFGLLCIATREGGEFRALGRAWHIGLSWARTPTGAERLAAIRTGGVTPAQLVVYDLSAPLVDSKPVRHTVAHGPAGGWESYDLPEPTLVEWSAADGSILHGRLYQSREPHGGVIVSCHGGPTDQTLITFNTRYAYWLTKGWTIFVPDHRGSTGWGREYRMAMNGGWGELDVNDVADGVRWLIASRRATPEQTVVMGGSAGGFCALHLLLRFPELFRCGVALYPVTDLAELDATTHRFERFYNQTLVGEVDRYFQRSPINLASLLKRPLLMLHGDSDPVVSVEQSRSFAAVAAGQGVEVKLVEYPGEGHGWKRNETTLDELQRIDAFLREHAS